MINTNNLLTNKSVEALGVLVQYLVYNVSITPFHKSFAIKIHNNAIYQHSSMKQKSTSIENAMHSESIQNVNLFSDYHKNSIVMQISFDCLRRFCSFIFM